MKAGTYDVLRWAEAQTCGGPGPKSVLMTLARMAGLQPDGRWACFPGQALIAEITEQSPRTVRAQLADLEAKGLIAREKRSRRGPDAGRGRTTDLTVLNYLPADAAASSTDQPADGDRPTGEPEPTYRRARAARKNQRTATEEPTNTLDFVEPVPERPVPIFSLDVNELGEAFEELWRLYPRRAGKRAAEQALGRALRRASLDEILAGVERAAHRWVSAGTEPRFIPHPATWLNQDRWADEDEPAPRGRTSVLDVLGASPPGSAAQAPRDVFDTTEAHPSAGGAR